MKDQQRTISASDLWKNLACGTASGAMVGGVFGMYYSSLPLGLTVGILAGAAVGYRIGRTPIKMQYPLHIVRRLLLAGALFLLLVLGFLSGRDHGWSGDRLTLVCGAAIIAWGILVFSIASAIGSLDEMQRHIQTEAISIGFAGTAIAVGGYGLLGIAGVTQVNWGLVPVVMVVMWLAGKLWTLWRYR